MKMCVCCVRYEGVFCRHWVCLGCVRSMPLLTTCALTCPVTSSTCSSAALFCWLEASLLVLLPWQLLWAVSLSDCCCKAVDFTHGTSQCLKSLWSLQLVLVMCESPLWSAMVGSNQCVNHLCGLQHALVSVWITFVVSNMHSSVCESPLWSATCTSQCVNYDAGYKVHSL